MSIWKCICPECGHTYYDAFIDYSERVKPSECPVCETKTSERTEWHLPEGKTWAEEKGCQQGTGGGCGDNCGNGCCGERRGKKLDIESVGV